MGTNGFICWGKKRLKKTIAKKVAKRKREQIPDLEKKNNFIKSE
jgi:hypothetical protein